MAVFASRRKRRYAETVEASDRLARFAAHHAAFYEQLRAQRSVVSPEGPGNLVR